MLRQLQTSVHSVGYLVSCRLRPQAVCRRLLTINAEASTSGGFHDVWRIRVFDTVRRRSYAVDLGNFPESWFLGSSTSLTISRSDESAGRPNSFKHSPKRLADLFTPITDLSHNVGLSTKDESVSISLSDKGFSVKAHIYGAALLLNTSHPPAENELSKVTVLQHKDVSSLKSQTLRLVPPCTPCF